ncbi:MAG: Sec-independent protein translocase TatA [Planctomycetota bacterium]|nr:MAG: Sec-independent protein translocase TatA [Planctomycetota bacterium]
MTPAPHILAFFQNLGWPELMIIGVIALLIFGRRLPEVGRSLGKGIVEFKKGLQDTGDEVKQMPHKPEAGGNRYEVSDNKKVESTPAKSNE